MEVVYAGIGAIIFSIYLVIDTQVSNCPLYDKYLKSNGQMMMGGSHKFSISPEEYVFAGKSAVKECSLK